jgi:hypothetical protein
MGYRRDNPVPKHCKDWPQFIVIIIIVVVINLTTTSIHNPTRKILPLMTLYVYKPYGLPSHMAQICNSMQHKSRHSIKTQFVKYMTLSASRIHVTLNV